MPRRECQARETYIFDEYPDNNDFLLHLLCAVRSCCYEILCYHLLLFLIILILLETKMFVCLSISLSLCFRNSLSENGILIIHFVMMGYLCRVVSVHFVRGKMCKVENMKTRQSNGKNVQILYIALKRKHNTI